MRINLPGFYFKKRNKNSVYNVMSIFISKSNKIEYFSPNKYLILRWIGTFQTRRCYNLK